jgi:hypothetical protein
MPIDGAMADPVRIPKTETLSPRLAYGKGAMLLATPFVLVGGLFAVLGFGGFELEGAHAPGWVIGSFGLAFLLAGLLLLANGFRGARAAARRRALAGAPLWERDFPWDPTGARDRAGARVGSAFVAAIFLAVFLVPFNFWAFLSGEGPLPVKLFVGLFDLILLLVVGHAGYRLGQLLKYGKSRLSFPRFPFFLGERLHVVFSPNRFAQLRFTLRHVEERFEQHGHGRNRTTSLVCYELYRDERTAEPGALEPEVRVAFDLPAEPHLSNRLDAPPIRYWELLVEADEPGLDFATTFVLPVYARSDRAAPTAAAAPTA